MEDLLYLECSALSKEELNRRIHCCREQLCEHNYYGYASDVLSMCKMLKKQNIFAVKDFSQSKFIGAKQIVPCFLNGKLRGAFVFDVKNFEKGHEGFLSPAEFSSL